MDDTVVDEWMLAPRSFTSSVWGRAPSAKVTVQCRYAPPTIEDLVALFRLCGGDKLEIVHLLARLWDASPEEITPTVLSWLMELPPYLPPSRSATALPVLPVDLRERLSTAAPPQRVQSHPALWRPRHAASAPVSDSGPSFAKALAGLYEASTRLNSHLPRYGSEQAGGRDPTPDVMTVSQQPMFEPVVLSAAAVEAVPEDIPVLRWDGAQAEKDALEAFMARAAVVQGKLMPTARSEWGKYRMRF